MKTFNYAWKFSGIRDFHNKGTISARNLPEALEKLKQDNSFRIHGTTLKRHGNRRIHFFGRCVESGIKISAPLVEGYVSNS